MIVVSFAVAHFCFRAMPDLFQPWNAKAVDRLFMFRASSQHFQPSYDETIAHVDITDSSLKRLKTYYLNRSHYARVIENLNAMNASAQLFDFIFIARSSDSEDEALIDAVERAGNIYMGLAFELSAGPDWKPCLPGGDGNIPYVDRTKWDVVVEGDPKDLYTGTAPITTFPELASASRGLGFLNLTPDRDGINRRIPLLVRYDEAFYPSLSFRSICDYLDVTPERIVLRPGRSIKLQDARRPGEARGRDIVIPVDRRGNMLIDFIGPWERMKHYNFADVYYASDDREEMERWRHELSGKILLVSEVTTGIAHLGPVPTDVRFPSGGIHTSTFHTILRGSFLKELSFHEMLVIEIAIAIVILLFSMRFSPLYFSLGSMALAVSYVAIAGAGFLYGNLVFHITRPVFIAVFAMVSIVVHRYIREEKARLFIRSTFGRFLSNEIVEELLGSPDGLKMSGEIREVTFLVSDLRGFTSLAARLSPVDVVQVLNNYFERMVAVIMKHRGTVDELQGDGMLVFFGAPIRAGDDAQRAVACAIEMQRIMPEINELNLTKGLPCLSMGIGIATGEVVVGNIGSEKRTKYGAVGSSINTAYRIESYTVAGQVLIDTPTYEKVQSFVHVRDTIHASFKGNQCPTTLYDVAAIGGNYNLYLVQESSEPLVEISPPLSVTCRLIEGKAVSGPALAAEIMGLSETRAELVCRERLHAYSNVLLRFHSKEGHLAEAYAKVLPWESGESDDRGIRVRIEFTSVTEEARSYLLEQLNT